MDQSDVSASNDPDICSPLLIDPVSPITEVSVRHPQEDEPLDEARDNKQFSFALLGQITRKVGFFQLNLGLVYFFEYMCLTSFAERYVAKMKLEHPERHDEFIFKHGYVIFSFCYQIGVFLSRSSLSVIKIPKVQILTGLQMINFVFFLFNTIFLFLGNFYVCFGLMVWVGLMGGGSYVNVMYQILESPSLAKNEKELALTMTGVCNDIGILLASLLSLLLANTAFKTT